MTDIPSHVGYILDGNRRWAKERGLPSIQGHAKGQQVLRDILRHTFKAGVEVVSVYAFSTENWSRDNKEVGYLMRHIALGLKKYTNEFHESGVRIVLLGDKAGLPVAARKALTAAEEKTSANTKATLALCLNYGGQQEIVDAVKILVQNGQSVEDITAESITANLYAPELPPCDLIVRTSGEQRLSNFMLWRAAYSELLFLEKNWPDMTKEDVDYILKEYKRRSRRFGG